MTDRILPTVDDTNRFYWDAARDHRLVLARCAACRTYAHPPRGMCRNCAGESFDHVQVSGRGTVYSWSVMNSPGNPGFDDKLPYVVLVVELEEQPALITIGNLTEGTADDLAIGLPVEVTWEDLDDVTLPQWRLVGGAKGAGT